MQIGKGGGGLAIAALAIFIVIGLFFTLGAPHTLALYGGSVTSLGWVTIYSNYPGLNGPAWLASVTLNGNGQNLTGFSAKSLNGSYSSVGTPVSINFSVTNYGYKYQYSTSPAQFLYYWRVIPQTGIYGGYSCGANCITASESYSGIYDYLTLIWSPYVQDPIHKVLPNWEAAYITACTNAGGQAILINQNTLNLGGGSFVGTYECAKIQQVPIAAIYTPTGSSTNIFNAQISVRNGTSVQSCSLSYQVQNCNVTGQLYAQLAGFSSTGQNYGSQQLPSVAQLSNTSAIPNQRYPVLNGQFIATNPISTQSLLTGSESSTFLGYVTANPVANPTTGTLYSNITLANVNSYNNGAVAYLFNGINTIVFSTKNFNVSAFNLNSNPYATLSFYPLTSLAPAFSAVVQVVAKFSTLGIGYPVAQPSILSVTPQPLTAGSGTSIQAVFSVQNTGSVGGTAYLSGSCNVAGNSFVSPSIYIAGGGTSQIPVTISAPINQGNTTATYPCTATAYSGPAKSSVFNFNLGVNTQCPPGTYYVNPTTCSPVKPVVTVTTICTSGNCLVNSTPSPCRQGYQYSNGVCVLNQTCPNNYVLNTSTKPPTCQPPPPATIPWYVFLGGILVLLVVVYLLATSDKFKTSTRGIGGGGTKRIG